MNSRLVVLPSAVSRNSSTAPSASSPAEQAECTVQLAFCIFELKWDERRDEARALLTEMLALGSDDHGGDGVALTPAARARISELLEDKWFAEQ